MILIDLVMGFIRSFSELKRIDQVHLLFNISEGDLSQ